MTEDAPPPRPLAAVGAGAHPQVAAMLARAFHDDPVFRWMLPDAATRRARMERLFALLLRLHGPHARIIAGPECCCASIWQRSESARVPFTTMLANGLTMLRVFGRHLPRALAVSDAIEAHFPAEPFRYVHFVGVEPAAQGKGWGRAMMHEGLAHVAAEGGGLTYLETARPENVAFYLGLGFTVAGEWDVAGGGPHFWSLTHRA